MPLYDYRCPKCGQVDTFSLVMDHAAPTCKELNCGCKTSTSLTRVFTATAVHFKGGGWTETTSQTKEKLAKLEKTRRLATMNDSD